MTQYRATISGNRGGASRLGTKSSGIVATVNGWNIGVKIFIRYDEKLKRDCIYIYETGGSSGTSEDTGKTVATLYEKEAK